MQEYRSVKQIITKTPYESPTRIANYSPQTLDQLSQFNKVHREVKSKNTSPNLEPRMTSLSKIVMGYNDELACINKKVTKFSERETSLRQE